MEIRTSTTKPIPLTLWAVDENDDEVAIELQVTKFKVADSVRRDELMLPVYEKDKELTPLQVGSRFAVARIMCSVKTLDGDYYFKGTVEDVVNSLDDDMAAELNAVVTQVNPFNTKKK